MRKVALITGGTRGIGYGIAECLARDGFDLAINGIRNASNVEEVVEKLKLIGVDVIYCQGNVGNSSERLDIINQVKDRFGQLNVLVNNAGIAPKERKDILESDESSFEEVLKINLQGPYFLSQSVANWMIDQKLKEDKFQACIINISSMSSKVASISRGEYCISKAGMSMMTQLFAVRLGEYDIPVFEVQPGVIETDMTSSVHDKYNKLINEGLCVQKRWGKPNDIGKVVSSLSDGSFSFSTGQVIMVDGGLTISRL